MLSCRQASQLLSLQQEQRLRLRQRMGLRLHLWLCAECRRFDRQLNALRRALRSADKEQGCCRHHSLPAAAKRRIGAELQRSQADSDEHRL